MMFGRKQLAEKIRKIEKNNNLEYMSIPNEREVVKVKWIRKTKLNQKGDTQKYKRTTKFS